MLTKNLKIKDTIKWVECIEIWYDKNDNPSGSVCYKSVQDFYKEFGERFVYSVHYGKDAVSIIFGNKPKGYVGEV
jgi:hypothetical protein